MTGLLRPRLLAARNDLGRGPVRAALVTGLVGVLWGGLFSAFVRVLTYFQTLGDFGPLLTQRLLVLLFLCFFGILVVSNVVAALTTFYLAADVNLLLAAPISFRRLHRARFVETAVSSSWMVLLFGLPAFAAYGVVYDAGPAYFAALVPVLAAFLAIPAALGVLVTTGLVMVFPARGTRDAFLVGSGILVGGAVLAVRLLDPERLAHESGLVGFAGFLAGFGGTGSPWLPTTWAAETLIPLLGARDGEPLFHGAMLASTGWMLYVVSATLVERVYLTAWSRAQVGRVHAAGPERPLTRWLARLAAPLPRVPRLLFVKDAAVFLRDASQWSQLLLLFAVVAIYLYNFTALPVNDGSALAIAMRDLAAVLNLGLGAFVTTAVAVRFVFPMPSLEGRAWWILRTAPVGLARVWWGKFWLGYVPLAAFAGALIAATNHQLGVPAPLTALFLTTLVPLVAALVSLGLAFGATYPVLDTRNAAQIATGFGAVAYMVSALGLIAAVVALEAWPLSRLLWRLRTSTPLGAADVAIVATGIAAALGVCAAAFEIARRRGLRALAAL